jgi:hypothetical protein
MPEVIEDDELPLVVDFQELDDDIQALILKYFERGVTDA